MNVGGNLGPLGLIQEASGELNDLKKDKGETIQRPMSLSDIKMARMITSRVVTAPQTLIAENSKPVSPASSARR